MMVKKKKVSRKRSSVKRKSSHRNNNVKNPGVKVQLPKMPEPPRNEIVDEREIAMDFATKVQKKFDRIVKASVLFGSQTQGQNSAVPGSDIDIILIVDDVSIDWDLELVSWYREELSKIISTQTHSRELHVNTVKLSTWWEDLMHGDPVVINILRYGEPLIDYGNFFNPLKALLLKGKIKSTPEAVHAALRRAPEHIVRSKYAQLGAIEGVYWAFVDAAQAALITAGKLPPTPEHVPQMLKETFVDTGMLKMFYVKAFKDIYYLHKKIAHGEIGDIKGTEIDQWQDLAEKFLGEITQIIDNLLEGKK